MDSSAHNAVAAAFSDREIAHACYEALERQGFPHRWMAVTKPADGDSEAWGDGSPESASENDVVESSDGALGAIGRFFSGEGNSLRRSLEDHGIDTDEAIEIDEALHLGGAVVVVAGHERSEIAASILREGGGLFYGRRARATAAPAPIPATGPVGDDETIVVPLTHERVAVEKIPVVREEVVVVGERRVPGVEHVGEKLPHEEREVSEPSRPPAP